MSASLLMSPTSNDWPITAANVSKMRVSSPSPAHPPPDDVADTLWQPYRRGAVDAPPSHVLVEQESVRLGQAPQDLAYEERVACGLCRDFGGQDDSIPVELVTGGGADHLGHLVGPEAFQRDLLHPR